MHKINVTFDGNSVGRGLRQSVITLPDGALMSEALASVLFGCSWWAGGELSACSEKVGTDQYWTIEDAERGRVLAYVYVDSWGASAYTLLVDAKLSVAELGVHTLSALAQSWGIRFGILQNVNWPAYRRAVEHPEDGDEGADEDTQVTAQRMMTIDRNSLCMADDVCGHEWSFALPQDARAAELLAAVMAWLPCQTTPATWAVSDRAKTITLGHVFLESRCQERSYHVLVNKDVTLADLDVRDLWAEQVTSVPSSSPGVFKRALQRLFGVR